MKKFLSALLAAAVIVTTFGAVFVASAKTSAQVTEYIEFTFTNGQNKLEEGKDFKAAKSYPIISKKGYTFKKGDVLVYDINVKKGIKNSTYTGFGSVDCNFATSVTNSVTKGEMHNLRDSGLFFDQNGVTGHTKANLYPYANNKWYHREIKISDDFAGSSTNQWMLAEEARNTSECQVLVANIAVKSKDGSKFVIFEKASDLATDTNNTDIPDVNVKSKSLKTGSTTATSESRESGNKTASVSSYLHLGADMLAKDSRFYVPFKQTGYTFKEGDVISYDVYCADAAYGTGGIDVFEDQNFKAEDNATEKGMLGNSNAVDQNNVPATGDTKKLAAYVGGKWYHREITVPTSMFNKKAGLWTIAIDKPDNIMDKSKDALFPTTLRANIVIANVKVTSANKRVTSIFTAKNEYKAFPATPSRPLGAVINTGTLGTTNLWCGTYSTPLTFQYTYKAPITPPAENPNTSNTSKPTGGNTSGGNTASESNNNSGSTESNGGVIRNPVKVDGDYLKITAKNMDTVNNSCYIGFSEKPYTVQKGDYLEYDIKIDVDRTDKKNYKIGMVEINFNDPVQVLNKSGVLTNTTQLSASLDFVDQNGIRGRYDGSDGDISAYANGDWYHRKIRIPDEFDGSVAFAFSIGQSATTTEEVSALLANIKITNDGKERVSLFNKATDFYDVFSPIAPQSQAQAEMFAYTAAGEKVAAQPVPETYEDENTNSGFPLWAIILIAVGGVVVIGGAVVVIVVVSKKKKSVKEPQ